MGLIGQITYGSFASVSTDSNGGTRDVAAVYITLYDTITGSLADGNCSITYTVEDNTNGLVVQTSHTVYVPGQTVKIYKGTVSETSFNPDGTPYYYYNKSFYVTNIAVADDLPAMSCDIRIDSVTINKKESAPGAADAQVTINADSSHGPIEYSLNDVTYQLSTAFAGLAGGFHTAYVKDANNCRYTYNFDITTLSSLLVSDPSVDLGSGNISRWNAAFNPIVFSYQRKISR